jgi:hypothetical protein
MADKKPILGYDRFLMMALLKEGPLSLEEIDDKTMLFLSLIWYQQIPQKSQPLMEKLFSHLHILRIRIRRWKGCSKSWCHMQMNARNLLTEVG